MNFSCIVDMPVEIGISNVLEMKAYSAGGLTDYEEKAHKKELLAYVDESDITVGTPAKFRKWYNDRDGEITLDDQ